MYTVLIAGGTGLLGKQVKEYLNSKGYKVVVLSRGNQQKDTIYWNPDTKEIDPSKLKDVTHIINLTGENIAKRWTNSYREKIYHSRIQPAEFLFSLTKFMPNLKHYISASGINAYPLENHTKVHVEEDAFGSDYLSQLCQQWEECALKFESICTVTIVRISVVITPNGGAISKMKQAMKFGFGQPIASGNQILNWIHIDDLVKCFEYLLQHELSGIYNANAGYATNREFTRTLAHIENKPFLNVGIPTIFMKLIVGEMAEMITKGVKASNQKLKSTGFQFQYENLHQALKK